MKMSTVWSVLGAILAIIIAWWIVSAVFSIAWFLVKAVIVIAVAAIVFGFIKGAFRSKDRQRPTP
ncbi:MULTISPECIES: hypothetical protein [Brevibacterium]|uniref:Flagellar biosynthesis protein FlhA n=1 Tax=Brevibacterium casei TaxID=33889 RepID=A0AB34Y2C8_9MICO|nr:hypothetical protein [Brevibacterium casei]NJE66986.1 hypothetical protein [Brevibacterium sp. LS14]KZE24539.1 flagellar biosynthesis protein FlhA [Brevibacterium casei]MBE4694459.1 hypothetical protein [Brevibacterium casei]MBY3577581.1 hypothetical protein [Brevibacterium casei]MCT1446856.1 hypothetical protein [Brevibacterium casei]